MARNALAWLTSEYLGADPGCTLTDPAHVCARRDGRLIRPGTDACHASASQEVQKVCALCLNRDPLMAPWNQSLVRWRDTWAHKGCADDFEYERSVDHAS